MPRPKNTIRMSLKGRDGVTVKIGFAMQADGRWAVYRDDRRSVKTPALNATQVGQLVSRWLRRQEFNPQTPSPQIGHPLRGQPSSQPNQRHAPS